MNEIQAYQLYLALRLHFTTDNYDYFKYNGKVSASLKSFDKRKDRYLFKKLTRKYDEPTILNYYIANFIEGNKWLGNMNEDTYIKWKARVESLEYIFKNDVEKLLTNAQNFDILFNSVRGNHPKILKAFLGKKISLETLVIFEYLVHYCKTYDNEIVERIIWPEVSRLIQNYKPFVKIDRRLFKGITLSMLEEHSNG